MAAFEVRGGQKLHGEIVPQGAKNEALQILCAVLLTAEPVTISNIPDIRDVNKLIELLHDMGVKVGSLASDTYRFQADAVNLDYLDTPRICGPGRGFARLGDDTGADAGALRALPATQTGGG